MGYECTREVGHANLIAVEPLLTLEKNVAIVGSSSSLLERNYGNEIDRHKEVVRFNGAPPNGYEEDVGSRTTVQVVGIDLAYQYSDFYVKPSKCEEENDVARKENARRMLALFPEAKFLTHDPRDEDRAKKSPRFLTAHYLMEAGAETQVFYMLQNGYGAFYKYYEANRDLERIGMRTRLSYGGPRSGIKIVMRCVISGIKPDLYGFDVDHSADIARHYHDTVINANVAQNKSHDILAEMSLLLEMQAKDMVRIRQ